MRLSLLLPARRHLQATMTVAHWLARGDRLADAAHGRGAALRECFAIDAAELPTAALTRSIDADDAGEARWLRADPAYVMADAVTLRLLACGNLGLSADETEAFAQTLKPLFGDAGFAFDAPHAERWYLRCERGAKLPKFSAPEEALGDDLANHLPEGDDARRWRSLLNEAQIILTQHPVNAQRARRGLPPVNSLWFWGAGVLPQRAHCGFDRIVSDDEVVVSLAKLGGVLFFPRQQETPFPWDAGQKQSILVDLADQRDVAALDRDWLRPMADALQRGQIAQLDLLFESGERYVVKPAHRWRFWRRAKATT